MNADSITSDLKQAQQEREQAARRNSEKLKTEWQNYLRAESQHFKNFIAETESRCRKLMRLADRVFDVIGDMLSLNDVNLPEMLRARPTPS
jgi:hypothetical protein